MAIIFSKVAKYLDYYYKNFITNIFEFVRFWSHWLLNSYYFFTQTAPGE